MLLREEEHDFLPIFDENSKILILGSFPSVISKREGFYYMNKQNRFWKVLGALLNCDFDCSIKEKIQLLKLKKIALFDVVKSCTIEGSSDSKLSNVICNDINSIIEKSSIQAVFLNGKKAFELFTGNFPTLREIAYYLPSTSSANASCSMEKLICEWKTILNYL